MVVVLLWSLLFKDKFIFLSLSKTNRRGAAFFVVVVDKIATATYDKNAVITTVVAFVGKRRETFLLVGCSTGTKMHFQTEPNDGAIKIRCNAMVEWNELHSHAQ